MSSNHIFPANIKVHSSFIAGFINTFRSFSIVKNNKILFLYFIIPFILNIALLGAIFYFSYTSLIPLVQSLLSGDQWYIQFIRFLVSPVLFILISIFTVLIYSIAGGIVTSPFLDLLSNKTEKILGAGNLSDNFSVSGIASDILRTTVNALRLLMLIIIINFILLLLNIIPGGSFIYAFLNFFSALFFFGFQFYDFPLERKKYNFNDKLRITWKFKWSVFGSGFAFFVISFIPVLGFLGLNLCTTGAALTFAEDIEPVLIKQK